MATINQYASSKTVWLNIIMALLQTANASIAMWKPILEVNEYVMIATILAGLHSALGVYIRAKTTTALADK